VIQISERLDIAPPIFRPRVPEWDAWLFKHIRSRELHARIKLHHRTFRLRHFFAFWLFFMRRNKRMRQAWISTAAQVGAASSCLSLTSHVCHARARCVPSLQGLQQCLRPYDRFTPHRRSRCCHPPQRHAMAPLLSPQHIEAMLVNAMNAFKANAAEARRRRRIRRAIFLALHVRGCSPALRAQPRPHPGSRLSIESRRRP
jgi:hypothetical protein